MIRPVAAMLLPVFAAGLLAAPGSARGGAPSSIPAASSLVGLWGVTRSFGPAISGELTIGREGERWRAAIGGTSAEVAVRGEELRFELPGGLGAFRGRRDEAGIRGHWVQPAGQATGVAWATPVALRPAGAGVWRGAVVPLPEAITLYMDVREVAGGLEAVLRNPDGYFGNAKLALVPLAGGRLELRSIQDGRVLLAATYDAGRDRISIPVAGGGPLPPLDATLELSRRERANELGYLPRVGTEPGYRYRAPIAEDDGWTTASLADVGLDAARISGLVQAILDTDPRPQTAPLVQALLVARDGKLVLEEYFYGFHKERPHDTRSGGKTLASILAGIAIDRDAPLAPETPVYGAFRGYGELPNPDPRKARMTLEHLMTMTSGFACDENGDETAPGNEDKMQGQRDEPDWYRFMLGQPLAAAPGERFAYCSGAVNLIGGIVRDATGRWIPELLDRELAGPLQFSTYHMNLTPTGEGYLGGGIHLRPRDQLKLGQLYLDGGRWNGARVVSQAWVERSIAPHPMQAGGTDGYNWHLNEIPCGDRRYREYEASGNGGQLVMVVPELRLVVGFSGGNYNNYGVWRQFRERFLPEIVSAALAAPRGTRE